MNIPTSSDILKSIEQDILEKELKYNTEKSSSVIAEYFQKIVEPRIIHTLSHQITFKNFKSYGQNYFCKIELDPSIFSPKQISSLDKYLKYQDIDKHFKTSRYYFQKHSFDYLHSFKKSDPQYTLFSNIIQQLSDKGYKKVIVKTDGFSSIHNIRVCLLIEIPSPKTKEDLS